MPNTIITDQLQSKGRVMNKPSKIAGSSEISIRDLGDFLLLRLGALDLIRECIVHCIENFEKEDNLLSAPYLLDLVISDCREEIINYVREG